MTAKGGGRPAPSSPTVPEEAAGEAQRNAAYNTAFVDANAAPIPEPYGECPCPGMPHPGGDIFFLRPELDVAGGFAFTSAFADNSQDESGMPLEQALGMAYLVAGIVGWTFLDANGDPIPASRANVGRLRWTPAVSKVATAAGRRYGAQALLPLVAGANRSSRRSPTGKPTSPRKPSSPRRRRRS